MTNRTAERSPHYYARVYGLLYLIHFLNPIAMAIRLRLIVPGDAATTVNNIMASESLFRISFVSDLIGQTVSILLVLILYKLLKSVNKNHASLMVIFVLVGVPIAMLNLLNQIVATLLLSGADYLTVFTADQLQALAFLFLNFHNHGSYIAMIFWGLWLLPLGYLVFKSGYVPRIIGVLSMIAGFGYLIDFFIFFLLPNFDVTISLYTFIAELILPFWLLLKGVKVPQLSDDPAP